MNKWKINMIKIEIDNIKKVWIKKAEGIYNKGEDIIMNKKGKELEKELEDFLKNEMNDLINKKYQMHLKI